MSNVFHNINDVYFYSLNELKKRGKIVSSVTDKGSVGSGFGKRSRDFIELSGFTFQLTNPRNRLIYSQSRKLSMGFNVANFIWFVSGSRDVDPISFYNEKGKIFSDNGKYYEAAFGDRLFGSYNLIEDAKRLLIADPTTRRAHIPLFFPADLKYLPKDTPCASSIQIMIRDNKVDFFLHMRSQSVIMVFPYDLFLFTMLHEYMSILLNKELGTFNYYANSFHYYTEEENALSDILKESVTQTIPMESMPITTIHEIPDIIDFEKYLRKRLLGKKRIEIEKLDTFSGYWKELLYLLCTKAEQEHDFKNQDFVSKYLIRKKAVCIDETTSNLN